MEYVCHTHLRLWYTAVMSLFFLQSVFSSHLVTTMKTNLFYERVELVFSSYEATIYNYVTVRKIINE